MNPSASSTSRWKVPDISAYIHDERARNHFLPFIALTETWLKPYMADAQLHVPGYSPDVTEVGGSEAEFCSIPTSTYL